MYPARRIAVLGAPWVRNDLWRRARAVPGLDLRFAENKSLTDAVTGRSLVTFTRASSGTYVDSQGVIKTAPTDEARFDHDPTTGESLGLLVEEQRTNLLLRSEEIDNASWTQNNIIAANNILAPNGQTTAETWTTEASQTATLYQVVACTAFTTYTFSFYVKLGTLPVADYRLAVRDDTNGVFIAQDIVPNITPVTTEWRRVAYTFTTPAGCVLVRPYLIRYSSVIGGTIHFWGAQLEAGAFPTSYIPTTTAAATRSADVASISGSNFSSWYRQDEGTVFTETQIGRQNTIPGAAICGIETNVSNTEAVYMHYRGSGLTAFSVFDNSVLQADFSPYDSAVAANTLVRQAGAIKLNDMVGIGRGVSQSTDTACTVPTPDRMLIGYNTAGNAYLSGTIRRLTYFPQRLPNTTLQAITQP